MSKLTLEHVARDFRAYAADGGASLSQGDLLLMADAIDAELKARGEPVAVADVERLGHGYPTTAYPLSHPNAASMGKLYTAPPAPKITNEALVQLARRCLWLAYVWNDHNFDAAHACARKTAEDVGIKSFEEANTWLQALKENP